jgi:hypothetical protein
MSLTACLGRTKRGNGGRVARVGPYGVSRRGRRFCNQGSGCTRSGSGRARGHCRTSVKGDTDGSE